ncbi:hypothetical protein [Phenylobacterium sp.]|jgi:hypothetical protein|uniref:hypothetical protein n=1 Tax=Phenylobacterium sp. TaxID=1871053 RepID=UPI002E30E466|nr:hypothetical protein [Phenylobacterium sp.]HEX3363742.1 hypothetical protein [Phenylobacterium sp.]
MTARGKLIGLSLAAMALPAAAQAAAWGSVGMVEAIRGAGSDDEVKVERAGEGRHVIGPHEPLYNGDHLVIRGAATACVNVSGARSCWTSRTTNTTVASHGPGAASILDAAFFRAIGLGPPAAGMGIVTGTVLRSAGSTTAAGVAAIGLLPAGPQHVTPAARTVVAAWRGPAQALTLTPEGGPAVSLSASAERFAEIPVPAGRTAFRIQLQPSEVVWNVSTSPTAPSPPWYAGRQPRDREERLARATWIVTDGPPEWRMFAFGELAELARAGFGDAPELYRAALEGRLRRRAEAAAS